MPEGPLTHSACLVTGSTGFIGRRLVEALSSQGHWVGTLNRRAGQDMCDAASLVGCCDNIDTVYHLAGYAHAEHDDASLHWSINYQGTANLLKEAHRAGVKSVVLVSSVKAGQPNYAEAIPFDAYGQAKRCAEQLLHYLFADRHAVVVRPALVYGAGVKGNLARMVWAMQMGYFPPLPHREQRRSLVDREDLVRALIKAAATPEAHGRTLIATSHTPTAAELYQAIRCAQGRPRVRWAVPYPLLFAGAQVGGAVEQLIRRDLPLNPSVLDRLFGEGVYSGAQIMPLLGLEPSSFEAGIAAMVNGA